MVGPGKGGLPVTTKNKGRWSEEGKTEGGITEGEKGTRGKRPPGARISGPPGKRKERGPKSLPGFVKPGLPKTAIYFKGPFKRARGAAMARGKGRGPGGFWGEKFWGNPLLG